MSNISRTAKQLAKQKDIRHVKSAIRWHERQRRQRQEVAEEIHKAKQTTIGILRYRQEVAENKRQALAKAKEDWKLGPLRPNRAIGSERKNYGVIDPNDLKPAVIPVEVQKRKNEVLERKGREVKYPLVVDDQKYFPIVKDDRVVVIRGKEKGKIGTVLTLEKTLHIYIIRGINMVRTSERPLLL